jgi:tRNA pseudouridine55 synthase
MLRSSRPVATAAAAALLLSPAPPSRLPRRFLSLTATPYPLYYDLLVHRPAKPPKSTPADADAPRPQPPISSAEADEEQPPALDRAQRRYLRKRRSRQLPDPDATTGTKPTTTSEMVELRPEVVDFPRLHAREEALYFHDTFAMPWEKDKHYRMLYRLEKKYFPEQSLDKAFVAADAAPPSDADKGLVFFEEEKNDFDEVVGKKKEEGGGDKGEVLERKVEDFFKSLKKGPGAAEAGASSAVKKTVSGGEPRQVMRNAGGEEDWPRPHLASRRTELPPRWDGPTGTVVLVDKPKGDAFPSALMNGLMGMQCDRMACPAYVCTRLQCMGLGSSGNMLGV